MASTSLAASSVVQPVPRESNAGGSSPISSLPNELLSHIFQLSLSEPWTHERERDLAVLGGTCRSWRYLTTSDPRLWTYISLSDSDSLSPSGEYQYHPVGSRDLERIQTLIARSGEMPLQIRISLIEGERTSELRECLMALKAQLHRCESIRLETNSVTGWEVAFPLRGPMDMLKSMHVSSELSLDSSLFTEGAEEGMSVKFFDNTPKNLEKLHVYMERPHLPNLEHVDRSKLKDLSLRAYVSHKETLPFVQGCTNLERLELECMKDDDRALFEEQQAAQEAAANAALPDEDTFEEEEEEELPVPPQQQKKDETFIQGIVAPALTDLTVHGPSATMLTSIVAAPHLSCLSLSLIDDSHTFALSHLLTSASSNEWDESLDEKMFPALESLRVSGHWYVQAPVESLNRFLRVYSSSSKKEKASLQRVELANFGGVTDVLASLSESATAGSIKQVRLIDGEDQFFPFAEDVLPLVHNALEANSKLNFTWETDAEALLRQEQDEEDEVSKRLHIIPRHSTAVEI